MANITSKNHKLTDEELVFINEKLEKLETFLPRHARKSAKIDFICKKATKGAKKISVEILIAVPGRKELTAKSDGAKLITTLESAENKIKTQIKKYKEEHKANRSLLHKILRRG